MENQFEKVIDIIIAAIIFFVFPVMYFSQRQDTIIEQVVSMDTSDFISTVNSHGKLTKAMYEDYIAKLDDTNVICNVKLEHKKLALEPEYRFRTAQEIINEQDKAYTGTNTFHYFPVSTELPVVDDNADNSGLVMNTETNESILAKSVHTAADPLHTHTDGCYVGAHEHGYNVLIKDHVHKASCYCPGHIHTDVSYDQGGHPTYDCRCDYCHKVYQYGTFTEGQQCTQLICGFNNGDYCNCYAPQLDAYIRSQSIELKCHTCGNTLYTISVNPWVPAVYVSVGNNYGTSAISYTFTGQSYYDEYVKLENWLRTLNDAGDEESVGCPHKIIPSGTVFNIPGLGQFKECFICNDYSLKESASGSSVLELRCMKCNQLVGVFFTTSTGYGAWLYKDGSVASMLSGDEAKNYYEQFSEALYGHSVPTGPRGESTFYPPTAPGATKFYHENHFSGGVLTTMSADANVLNTFPLSSYVHHGCAYNAGKNLYCGMDGELKCHDIVKSITPTNPVQTVYVGEPLITTATATYMDGSTGVVLCNADFTASAPVKNKTVTLSYVNIKNQTLTCTETVTVIPKTKVCVNGHTYNLNADGTDPGCPYCRAWLKSLEIFNPTDGKITIYRGTTLKENGVVLLATYFDGRKEYVENDYVDNLDKYYVGTQNVTISYKGKDVTLFVTTKRNIVQCPICHHYYELYPDDTDPGCPYCKAKTPVFTGNVLKYYSQTYSDEILKELYEGTGTYTFKTGDYFSVSVTNKSETLGTKVLGFVIHGVPRTSIHVEKGGTVGEDAYGEHDR